MAREQSDASCETTPFSHLVFLALYTPYKKGNKKRETKTDRINSGWNRLAHAVIGNKYATDVLTSAKFYAQLNYALSNAAIASWDSKYFYNSWRPITAIRYPSIYLASGPNVSDAPVDLTHKKVPPLFTTRSRIISQSLQRPQPMT